MASSKSLHEQIAAATDRLAALKARELLAKPEAAGQRDTPRAHLAEREATRNVSRKG